MHKWQQSEDVQRKKEIRSHLYKLRESRLRDLYQADIMSDQAAFSKDPLTTSHGDSLADQSFQSLKSKEIRDSMSPTHDIKFHALALNQQPNTTGWNVQASTEVSPDGRAYRTETLATTDGIEKINGGLAEFKGRNEQRSSASHQGDDKNFVKKAADSSSTHLQEHVVIGDENSGRIEKKVSSTTSSSTSEFISSSTTGGDFFDRPAAGQPRYLADSHLREQQQRIKEDHYHQQQQHRIDQERQAAEAQHRQGHRMTDQERREREERITEEYNRRQRQESSSRKVETTQQTEKTKRYVDMDKASPEYQQHVQYLMAQEGEIISNTVEYPKPNVKMITTVKRLPDGTIVRNKRYETEELNQPAATESRRTSTTQESNNRTAQQKRTDRSTADNLQTRIRESRENQRESVSPQKQSVVADVVDNVVKQYSDAEEVSYSSVQKSSRKFSTETSSETVEQYSDRPEGARPAQTQGFPSVKPGVATQEFPNERPFGARPSDGYSTQGFPSVRPDKLTQEFRHQSPQPASPGQTVTKTIGPDGEIIVTVSKESVRNVKQKSSSEHVEIRESREGSTHGFPSVRDGTASPIVEMPQTPLQQQRRSKSPDFSTHGFPSARSPTRTTTTVSPRGGRPSEVDGELIQVSSEKSQKSSYKTNSEHIVETKVVGSDDYSTNGFPSVRSPTKATSTTSKPDFSTHGFPSVRETSKVDGRPTQASPQSTAPQATPGKTQPTAAQNAAGARKYTNTSTTTDSSSQRFVQKEKETDAAHRAFAASLRSASPIDGGQTPRRGDTPDYHLRPRSSVSSGTTTTKTYRRDQREGSHDSTHNAPSESSRISSHTVTRQSTPGKPATSSTAARTSLTKQTTSSSTRTRQVNGSNETIDLVPSGGQRSTKSPSPAKIITTKTSSTTINTNKAKPTAVTTTTKTITSSSPAPASPTVSPVVAKPGPERRSSSPSSSAPSNANKPQRTTLRRDNAEPLNQQPSNKPKSNKKRPTDINTFTDDDVNYNDDEVLIDDEIIDEELLKITEETQFQNETTIVHNIDELIEINENESPQKPRQPTTRPLSKQPNSPNTTAGENKPRQQPSRRSQSPETPLRPSSKQPNSPNSTAGESKPRQQPSRRSQSPETQKPQRTEQPLRPSSKQPILPNTTADESKPRQQPNRRSQSPELQKPQTTEPSSGRPSKLQPQPQRITNDSETERVDELFTSSKTIEQSTRNTKTNINEEFITKERSRSPTALKPSEPSDDEETPDGSFFSKQTEPQEREPTTTSPRTYRKKGLERRETFEERCRVILGMENDGDTQGNYKPKPDTDDEKPSELFEPRAESPTRVQPKQNEKLRSPEPEAPETKPEPTTTRTTFEVRIEDCEDDEVLSISNVRTALKVQKDKVEKTSTTVETAKKQPAKPKPQPETTPKTQPQQRTPSPEKSLPESAPNTQRQKSPSPTRKTSPTSFTPQPAKSPSPVSQKKKPESYPEPEQLWQVPTKPQSNRKTITQTTEDFITTEKKTQLIVTTSEDEEVEQETLIIEEITEDSQPQQPPKGPEQFEVEEIETIVTETTKRTKAPRKPLSNTVTIEQYEVSDDVEEKTLETKKVLNIEEETKERTTKQPQRPRTKSPSSKESSPERPSKRVTAVEKTTTKVTQNNATKDVEEPLTNGKAPKGPKDGPSDLKTPTRNKPTEPLKDSKTPTKKRPSLTTNKESTTETLKSSSKVTKTSTSVNDETLRTTVKEQSPVTTKTPKSPTTNGRQSRKPTQDAPTGNIKDRLRSSPRKHKPKSDDIDGTATSSSSTETSPVRYDTERRRSSNISVHTEIIIDHVAPKSPKTSPKSSPKVSPEKEMPSFEKPLRQRMPVTERKESAPVQRVTRKEKEMTRSTSENVMKVTGKLQPEPQNLRPSTPTKAEPKRPNKCFTTKTINLSSKDNTLHTEHMENVIIDIQHAKSSREPSPDKIVPTPVPAHLDTGKPRYPDVVQEPEDEPNKQPKVNNIPIFEEDTNEYVKCHITEINVNGRRDLHELREAEEILVNPTIEAPVSLDLNRDVVEDESLLTVTEKVAKFAHTAEEVSKPKASSPFSREFDDTTKVPENDECLLTINQKVDKFLKDAESITKQKITITRSTVDRPNYDDLDEELRQDECTLSVSQKVNKFLDTAEKLAPTAPQKSPRLVASIERSISKQEPEEEKPKEEADEEPEEEPAPEKEPLEPFTKQHTVELEKRRQKDILARSMVWVENTEETELLDQQNQFGDVDDEDEEEEPVPMSKNHTTSIEIKRQKNILNRPSAFENKTKPTKTTPEQTKPKPGRTTTSTTTTTTTRSATRPSQTTQPKQVPEPKNRPTDLKVVTKLTANKVSTTRSRFEPKSPKSPERRPSGPLARPIARKPLQESRKVTRQELTETDNEIKKFTSSTPQPVPEEEPVSDFDTTECNPATETETETEETYSRRSSTKSSKFISSVDESTRRSTTPSKPSVVSSRTTPFIVDHNSPSPTSTNKLTTTTTTSSTIKSTKSPAPTTMPTSSSRPSDIEPTDNLLEKPQRTRPAASPLPTKRISSVTSQSVAARRNIFESSSTSSPVTKGTPSKSPARAVPDNRRPSYMDHTKCSLEHMRRDSLELNKQNYTRKPSGDDLEDNEDTYVPRNPNSSVKFAEPERRRKETEPQEPEEEIDIEEIWELEVLERLLETVTSYELRRRIRAQIRLVKKNQLNTELSETKTTKEFKTVEKTHIEKKSSSTSYKSEEEVDTVSETRQTPKAAPEPEESEPRRSPAKPRDRSHSPTGKTISSSLKEVRRTSDGQTLVSSSTTSSDVRQSPVMERKHTPEASRSPVMDRKLTAEASCSPVMDRKQTTEIRTSRITSSSRNRSPIGGEVSPQRQPSTTTTTPRRTSVSPVGKTTTPAQPRDRSRSPQQSKTTKQQRSFISTTSTKSSSTRSTPQSPERRPAAGKPSKVDTPIWADRSALLKKPSTSSPTPVRATSATKTQRTMRTTMSTQRREQKKEMENEDCVTSSYGIGPTDENGLPLFGIRALKKKTQQQQEQHHVDAAPTCDTTEEVSGYVVEEKFYSDGKSEPIKERKEYIYSTNAEELEAMKKQVETRKLKSGRSNGSENIVREYKKVDKEFLQQEPKDLLENEEFITSSTKNVRRGSVKEMSEKFIRKESSQSITEKTTSSSSSYPKAGLILRTNSRLSATDALDAEDMQFSDAEDEHIELQRSSCLVSESGESESESVSIRRNISESKSSSISKSSHRAQSTRSFTNSSGDSRVVTGMDDVLERMRNADNVVESGDSQEDQEARALLNKFLGASVIMHGVGGVLPKTESVSTTTRKFINQEGDNNVRQQEVKTTRVTKTIKSGSSSSTPVTASTTCDIEEIWDEEILKELLEQAKTYEERRKIRARLRELMAEREAHKQQQSATSSSSTTEKTATKSKDGAVVTTTTKVTTRTVTGNAQAAKSVSPFAKFKQLDKQNSTQKSPSSPTTPSSGVGSPTTASSPSGNAPIFKFTDPALNARAATVKEQLLQWCQMKTQEYENVQITNFSTAWSDGLAFCALIHHFLPDAFDYSKLTPQSRRHNFELAFKVADEKAGIAPLLDVEDMVVMKRPDWKCVFVYVQSIWCRFRNCQ